MKKKTTPSSTASAAERKARKAYERAERAFQKARSKEIDALAFAYTETRREEGTAHRPTTLNLDGVARKVHLRVYQTSHQEQRNRYFKMRKTRLKVKELLGDDAVTAANAVVVEAAKKALGIQTADTVSKKTRKPKAK